MKIKQVHFSFALHWSNLELRTGTSSIIPWQHLFCMSMPQWYLLSNTPMLHLLQTYMKPVVPLPSLVKYLILFKFTWKFNYSDKIHFNLPLSFCLGLAFFLEIFIWLMQLQSNASAATGLSCTIYPIFSFWRMAHFLVSQSIEAICGHQVSFILFWGDGGSHTFRVEDKD